MERLTFGRQMGLGLLFLLLMFLCGTVFRRGIFVNIAWIVYGLAFVLHPVAPTRAAGIRHITRWVRLAGGLVMLLGVLTRFSP